jgi:hypothetical protein
VVIDEYDTILPSAPAAPRAGAGRGPPNYLDIKIHDVESFVVITGAA